MKIHLFCTLVFLLLCFSTQGQHPSILTVRNIGGSDYDRLIVRPINAPDGDFILSISSGSSNGNVNTTCANTTSRFVFNKYDGADGSLKWQKCIPYDSDSAYWYLFTTASGHFIAGGSSTSGSTAQQFLVHREDASGNILWAKPFGGSASDLLRDMIETSDGGYLLLGESNSNDGDVGFHYGGQFNLDIWVLKIDSNGSKEWSTVIGGTNDDEAYSVVERDAGGYYILGSTFSNNFDCIGNHGLSDALLVRLDDTGGKVWSRCLGGSDMDAQPKGWTITTQDGSVLLTTTVYSTDGDITNYLPPTGDADIWLAKVDSNNNLVWGKCYGGSQEETANFLARGTDESLWIGGTSRSSDGHVTVSYGNEDAYLLHIDTVGNFLSSHVFGSPDVDAIVVIQALPGGVVLAGGVYNSPGIASSSMPVAWTGLTDVFLAKVAPWTTNSIELTAHQSRVFPNPSTRSITVETDVKTERIRIFTVTGVEVYRTQNTSTGVFIDVSKWSKGVYYVEILGQDDALSYTRLLII